MAKFQRQRVTAPTNKQSFYPLTKSITEIPITKFNHLWTIKNFSIIPTDFEFICCPNFSPPDSKDKWFMKLRPKSVDEGTGNEYIGIHLFLRSCEDKNKHQIRAKYVISVLDAEGDRRFTGECSKPEGRIFKAGTEGHGYKLLAPRDVLLSAAHNMLGTDDTLQVLCEITVFGDMINNLVPAIDTNLYTESELSHGSMARDFCVLLSSPNTEYDTVVEAKDGVQFKAHKLILKTRSKVFEAMFDHETREKAESRIEIPDFDSAVIREMINFIYTDKVDDEKIIDVAGDLLVAADKYDLPRLKHLCEQYLAANMTSDSSGYLLTLSDMCSCEKLKEKVMEFIVTNPDKSVGTETWDMQVGKRPYLYKETLHALIKKQRQS